MSEQTAKPSVFLLGSQRSGTTMLRLMLNNHPSLSIPHESAFITICFRRLSQYGDLGQKDNTRKLLADVIRHPLVQRCKLVADPDAILARPIRDYRDSVDAGFSCFAAAKGKPRWGQQTPFYKTHIAIIRCEPGQT